MRLSGHPLRIPFLAHPMPPRRLLSPPVHRLSSTSSAGSSHPSPHTQIYRTHGRAMLKVLALSFFFYQVLYWSWLNLENDDLQVQKKKEVDVLEGVVRELAKEKKGDGK